MAECTCYEIVRGWLSLGLTDNKTTLVRVVATGNKPSQATNQYWASVHIDLFRHVVSLGHNELISGKNMPLVSLCKEGI